MTTAISPTFQHVANLKAGLVWVHSLMRQGHKFRASTIYEDRIRKPHSHQIKVLGVCAKAEKEVNRTAPDGKWSVEISEGNGYYCAMAWYNRFAPYAYSMCQSEHGYECMGIDYESINSYYGTVMGFVNLGTGLSDTDAYQRIAEEDRDLFADIYSKSCRLHTPQLPFEEAFWPCAVFLAVRCPKLFVKQFGTVEYGGGCYFRHALQVLEALDLPIPEELKRCEL